MQLRGHSARWAGDEPRWRGAGESRVDFVVGGFGLGAAIVLLGFAIRDLGPALHARSAAPTRLAWLRLCRELGAGLIGAGVVLFLVTLVPLFLGASDSAGSRVVLVSALVVLVVFVVTSAMAFRRYRARVAAMEPEFEAVPPPLEIRPDPAAFWPERRTAQVQTPVSEEPASEPAPEPVSEPALPTQSEPEQPEPAPGLPPEPVPAPSPRSSVSGPPRFESPLLADITPDDSEGPTFRSRLLAEAVASAQEGGDASRMSSLTEPESGVAPESGDEATDAGSVEAEIPEQVQDSASDQPEPAEEDAARPADPTVAVTDDTPAEPGEQD